jgi:hypothetical protein
MRTKKVVSVYRLIFACGTLMLALPNAWGGSPEAQERAARKACLLGDVAKGTEILADLYLDTKNPTYIYNQARCFEQNGKDEQALLRFREYLRKAPKLPAAEAIEVKERIKALEERTRGTPPPASPPPVSPPPATVVTPEVAVPPSSPPQPLSAAIDPSPDPLQIRQPPPPPAPESDPVYKRWWFWSGIGVVVVGGVVAAVLLSSRGASHSSTCEPGFICVPQ